MGKWFPDPVEWGTKAFKGIIDWILNAVVAWFVDKIQLFIEWLLEVIVVVPHPRSEDIIALGQPDNTPWDTLYSDMYLQAILPLALGIWFLAIAYFALSNPWVSDYKRKKMLRRLALSFVALLLWWPMNAAFLTASHWITAGLAPDATAVTGLLTAKIAGGGVIIAIIVYFVQMSTIALALFIFLLRYVAVMMLAVTMPVLFVLWALDWPLHGVSNAAKKIMSFYPGFVLATLPAALVIRFMVATNLNFGLGGVLGAFLGAISFVLAAILALATIWFSASTTQQMAVGKMVRGSQSAAKHDSVQAATQKGKDSLNHHGSTFKSGLTAGNPTGNVVDVTQDGYKKVTTGNGGNRYQNPDGTFTNRQTYASHNKDQSRTWKAGKKTRETLSRVSRW